VVQKSEWGVRGVVMPVITPFKEDLGIDWEGLDKLVEYTIHDMGCAAILPCGTTGESPTLSHEEHTEVVRFVVDRTAGRIPVIAGTGSNSTSEAITLTKAAKEVGADASLQVCPYYNKPTQEGIFRHFKSVSEEADLPIILYNIPGRTSRNIEPETTVRLWKEVPQIIGLKEASGDQAKTMEVLRNTDSDTFAVYSGEDIMTFNLLCLGGAGAIAAVAHVMGKEVKEMCEAVWHGDLERARKIHFQTIPVVKALFCEPNPSPVKQALEWMGLPAGPLRSPLLKLSPEGRKVLREALESGGWL